MAKGAKRNLLFRSLIDPILYISHWLDKGKLAVFHPSRIRSNSTLAKKIVTYPPGPNSNFKSRVHGVRPVNILHHPLFPGRAENESLKEIDPGRAERTAN